MCPIESGLTRILNPSDWNLTLSVCCGLQRIVKADWSVPAGETISDECTDLLTGILQPDPAKRLTVEDIVQHPWYQSSLPERAGNPDYPPRPEDGLQVLNRERRYVSLWSPELHCPPKFYMAKASP